MAEINDTRISSATFFTTQVDFTDAGDLKVFVDAEQLKAVEEKMAETGYLDGSHMATAFNMLRPNDLIWSYWVNNYLKGKEPMAFDLLVWNSDSTRMPAANHRFYLRHCYLQNDLTKGRMVIEGKTINLKNVTIPIYDLATKEDHIAPARSVFTGAKFFGGPVRYVLSGSGHIAGVVNPADKPKYQYWTGGRSRRTVPRLARRGQGDAGLLVARLDRLGDRAGARKGPRSRARQGQAEAARGRAGGVREGQGLAGPPSKLFPSFFQTFPNFSLGISKLFQTFFVGFEPFQWVTRGARADFLFPSFLSPMDRRTARFRSRKRSGIVGKARFED